MSSPDLSKILEQCIRMGEPLMIEDMETTTDPILEPVLLKHFESA